MLQPKRTKFRKQHKGRIHGLAKGGTAMSFGSYGIKAMEPERITSRQIEATRRHWGVPRFDLLQVHNLLAWRAHLATLQAMKAGAAPGPLRYVGVTTSHGRRHEELERVMKTMPLDFIQVTYNPVDRRAEGFEGESAPKEPKLFQRPHMQACDEAGIRCRQCRPSRRDLTVS